MRVHGTSVFDGGRNVLMENEAEKTSNVRKTKARATNKTRKEGPKGRIDTTICTRLR